MHKISAPIQKASGLGSKGLGGASGGLISKQIDFLEFQIRFSPDVIYLNVIIWQGLYLSIYLQKSKMGRYFPSEEKEGGKTGHKEEIIRITDDAIKKAKAKAFHKPAKEHGNKSYRKKKKKGAGILWTLFGTI